MFFTGIVRDVTERHHRERADPLTGLANRLALAEAAAAPLAAAAGGGGQVGLLLVDLDRFRDVNSALGHAQGDVLLQRVAAALYLASEGHGLVARLRGDEFGVLVPVLGEGPAPTGSVEGDLRRLAHELLDAVAGPFDLDGIGITVEGTVGVAVAPGHGATLDELVRRADTAVYRAKDHDTRVVVWEPSLERVTPDDLALLAELPAALREGQLRLHYQPSWDVARRGVTGVEALVRWAHPARGLLAPDAWLPLLEPTELVHRLTEWVLDEALAQAARWRREGVALQVSVNLSARSLVRPGLAATVAAALRRHHVEPAHVTLEVTETALMGQPERARRTLDELRALGTPLSLDDFGTGYTSLSMLTTMCFDEIKIDRSFVAELSTSASAAAVVASVIELGHRLGLDVVAEGVEDEAQRQVLEELGCDRLQGYLLGRPQPAHDLVARPPF